MQTMASLPSDHFLDLLRRLPPTLDLDRLARETKAIQRERKLTSGRDLLRMALARGPGGLSLKETAAWGTMLGLAEMSDPAMKKRLDRSVDFLDAIMTGQLAAVTPGAAVRWTGRCLRCGDSTSISRRGSKGTDWRGHAGGDLGRGGVSPPAGA